MRSLKLLFDLGTLECDSHFCLDILLLWKRRTSRWIIKTNVTPGGPYYSRIAYYVNRAHNLMTRVIQKNFGSKLHFVEGKSETLFFSRKKKIWMCHNHMIFS